MKKSLLASTALVAAAITMGATNANAMKLSLGGVIELWVGFADNDDAITDVVNEFDVKLDSEIHFKAEEKLDNGWKVGALLEMEAGSGNDNAKGPGFDESFGWIKASWGQLNIGNNDVATGYTGGVSVVGPVGIIKSDAGDWIPGSYQLSNTDVDLSIGDAQNLTYFTPRVGGAQVIVSYTPDASDAATSDYDDSETTGRHQAISIAVKYGAKLGGAKVDLSGGYTTLEESDSAGTDGESEGFTVAIKVGSGPVTFTWAYAKELRTSKKDTFWGIGLIYAIDKSQKVSVGFGEGEASDQTDGTVDEDSNVLTFGYEKKLGKGVSLAGSVFRAEVDPAGSDSDFDNWGAVGGLKIKF